MPDISSPIDLHFPKGGMELSLSALKQPWREGPPRPGGEPTRIYTTVLGVNVRGFDPLTRRLRGGSRVGLKRYVDARVNGDFIVQNLSPITGAGYNDPTTGMPSQGSMSGRVVNLVAVSQGLVYVASPGDTTWTATTNNSSTTPPLNASGVVFSDVNNQKLYLTDGQRYRVYTPIANTVEDWTLTAGVSLPKDDQNNKARLIRTWRGRTVLAGIIRDPHNWFMSRVSDPTDFDYAQAILNDPTSAISGNNSRMGFIGDVITALMAYTDDELIFGGDSSIYIMRGDPMQGGEIHLVTNSLGVAWGEAFCQDPAGRIYFMANTGSIYMMTPQSAPEEISLPIRKRLNQIDTGANSIRLLWDERFKGLHIFVTNTSDTREDTDHFFWEQEANAWWIDRFPHGKFNPLACCTIDGNDPNDRVPLIGCGDGYVRSFDPDTGKDDGYEFESEVWLGPLLTKNFDAVMLKHIQAILAASSGAVSYEIYVGKTPEEALTNAPTAATGVFAAGRNSTRGVRRKGHAIFIRLFSTNKWAIEGVRAALSPNFSKITRRMK